MISVTEGKKMTEENRTLNVSETVWSEQEKERRSKFSWFGRRLEDGRIFITTGGAIGLAVITAAFVLVPWLIGMRAILKSVF